MFYKLIKWRLISSLLLVPIYVYPQLQQTRFDTLISNELEAYEVLPAQTHGVILCRNFSSNTLHQVEITLLDTAFHNVWSGFTPLAKHRLITKVVKDNFLYLIFYKDEGNNFSIYQINLTSKEFLEYTITNTFISASTVNVTSKGIIIGGEFNYTPSAIFFEFATGTTRVLTGFFYTRSTIVDIETHEDGSFDILGIAVMGKAQTIWVNSYSPSGNLNKNVLLSNDTKYDLVYEKAMVTSQNSLVVAGFYGHVWGSGFNNKGLFIAHLDNGVIKKMQYHHFRELACLPKHRGGKNKRKNDTKKLGKGESFKIQALAEHQNQVIVLGEIFSDNLVTDYSFPTYESPKPVMEPLRIDSKSTKSFFHESINPPLLILIIIGTQLLRAINSPALLS